MLRLWTDARRAERRLGRRSLISVAAAALFLMFVGALAGYLPARRATRVDPVTALRYE